LHDSNLLVHPLAIIDSGVGGLPYLETLRSFSKALPMVYVADTKYFPYGEKKASEVVEAVFEMLEALRRRFDPCAVLVACNTASVLALDALRAHFPLPFIGVVPAVKPAAQASLAKRIAVIATQQTIKGFYLDDLVKKYAPDVFVYKYAASSLVSAIEADPLQKNPAKLLSIIEDLKTILMEQRVDQLVLGCTHFLHVENLLAQVLEPDIQLMDSRQGVAKQVLRVLEGLHSPILQGSEPVFQKFFLTKMPENPGAYERLSQKFSLEFGGLL